MIDAAPTCAANPWGLHNVIGNVWEFCRNGPYFYGTDPGSAASTDLLRSARGGGKRKPREWARSAARWQLAISDRMPDVGLRPARAID